MSLGTPLLLHIPQSGFQDYIIYRVPGTLCGPSRIRRLSSWFARIATVPLHDDYYYIVYTEHHNILFCVVRFSGYIESIDWVLCYTMCSNNLCNIPKTCNGFGSKIRIFTVPCTEYVKTFCGPLEKQV